MSGELLLMMKLNERSSRLSVLCCSGNELKHIAVKSEVENETLGGYRISISGPTKHSLALPVSHYHVLLYPPISTLKLQTTLSL
jgi:hypothetical protein